MANNFEPDLIKMSSSIIKVIGVGGGGSNAVNHMFLQGIEGVEFFVCNTDAQALIDSPVPNRIQLGLQLTEGLGAGSEPEQGRKAAMESVSIITDVLSNNTKMVFVTAGMGGGTGTGAAPVIAKIAKELGILTVGIVTIPFEDEGPERNEQAAEGIRNMKPHVDAMLTICNDRIVDMYGDLPVSQAFAKADDILCTAARGIAEIITKPGKLNVDFKDVQTAMTLSGRAIMGTGIAKGDNRAEQAAQGALDSPLLDNTRILGAKHLLVNFTYGTIEPLLSETSKVKKYLQQEAGHTAHLKMGITHDAKLGEEISITVIATGFEEPQLLQHMLPKVEEVVEEISPENSIGATPQPIEIPEAVPPPMSESSMLNTRKRAEDRFNLLNGSEENLSVPAYKRKNVQILHAPDSSNSNISRLEIGDLSEAAEEDVQLKKNKFLHDNID